MAFELSPWIYTRFTETTQARKDGCIDSFEQFSQDLDSAGVTDDVSSVGADDLVLGSSTAGFSSVYHETLGVSVDVVRLEGNWYVYGNGSRLSTS